MPTDRTFTEELSAHCAKLERRIRHLIRKRAEIEGEIAETKGLREEALAKYEQAISEEAKA